MRAIAKQAKPIAKRSSAAVSKRTSTGSDSRKRSASTDKKSPKAGSPDEWERAFSINLDALKQLRIIVGGHGVVVPVPSPRPPRRLVVEVIWK